MTSGSPKNVQHKVYHKVKANIETNFKPLMGTIERAQKRAADISLGFFQS